MSDRPLPRGTQFILPVGTEIRACGSWWRLPALQQRVAYLIRELVTPSVWTVMPGDEVMRFQRGSLPQGRGHYEVRLKDIRVQEKRP